MWQSKPKNTETLNIRNSESSNLVDSEDHRHEPLSDCKNDNHSVTSGQM